MVFYIARRIVSALSVVLVVIVASFGLFYLAPSDPAAAVCGTRCTPARIAQISKNLNLDQPKAEQLVDYFEGIFVGHTYVRDSVTVTCSAPCLGYSYKLDVPVTGLVTRAIPVTDVDRRRRRGGLPGSRPADRHHRRPLPKFADRPNNHRCDAGHGCDSVLHLGAHHRPVRELHARAELRIVVQESDRLVQRNGAGLGDGGHLPSGPLHSICQSVDDRVASARTTSGRRVPRGSASGRSSSSTHFAPL